jgi:hypothetical protein
MRKIEYIFIDSDTENNNRKSGRHDVPNFGYHYVVNSEGLVLNPTGISIPAHIIRGPIYDPDKYNDCSIFIRYCGSIRPEVWLMQSGTSCSAIMAQRAALLQLLAELRQHFPDAKILDVSEIDSRELYSKNIIVSDAMNVLRKELSNLL